MKLIRLTLVLEEDEMREVLDSLRFSRRGLERLLSAGYPQRTSHMDRALLKRMEKMQELIARFEDAAR